MLGYPPSPAVEPTKPLPMPPISPADKIPTNKEQELFTIQTLNKRLKTALERDKNENIELEQKRLAAKDVLSKAKQDLDRITWSYTQASDDLLTHKKTWASTEADLFTKELNNNDTRKYINHLSGSKEAFIASLTERIAKKEAKLASLDKALRATETLLKKTTGEIDGLVTTMHDQSDAIKQKMVAATVLENEIREANHVYGLESYHEKRLQEKCEPYGDLDPESYASAKEIRSIRTREKDLENRFQKIYEDTVAQMTQQHQFSRDSYREKQKQSTAERHAIEAQIKEWQTKRLQHFNDIAKLERELSKAQQENQSTREAAQKAESEIPPKEKSLSDINDQIGILKAELQSLSQKVEDRERNCVMLSSAIKAKQDAAAKAKQDEESMLAELKDKLQSKKHQLEEATIGLFPEISKYRGLVDVVEVKLTPQSKRQKRATL